MTPRLSSTIHTLHCHPATPAGLALDVSVSVGWTSEGLRLVYAVTGDTAALRIPPAAVPGPADGLWQHTCLEAFVAAEGDAAYREFNFSPSGQWAAYRFASERVRDAANALDIAAPALQLAVASTGITLSVDVPLTALPSPAKALQLALCAVIEEHDARLSYWSLCHPQTRPDFHHPAGRSLRLALSAN